VFSFYLVRTVAQSPPPRPQSLPHPPLLYYSAKKLRKPPTTASTPALTNSKSKRSPSPWRSNHPRPNPTTYSFLSPEQLLTHPPFLIINLLATQFFLGHDQFCGYLLCFPAWRSEDLCEMGQVLSLCMPGQRTWMRNIAYLKQVPESWEDSGIFWICNILLC
jgi:hypothetical protein